MLPNPLEGSWEEIQTHASELKGHRVKLIITDQESPKTLADFLEGYIGAVKGTGENVSDTRPLVALELTNLQQFFIIALLSPSVYCGILKIEEFLYKGNSKNE